jgi:hypothetical protein
MFRTQKKTIVLLTDTGGVLFEGNEARTWIFALI